MPYIPEHDRERVHYLVTELAREVHSAGEANYVITKIVTDAHVFRQKSYLSICLVVGTLLCVLLEYYRRFAAPYEDSKCAENGDIPVYAANRTPSTNPSCQEH